MQDCCWFATILPIATTHNCQCIQTGQSKATTVPIIIFCNRSYCRVCSSTILAGEDVAKMCVLGVIGHFCHYIAHRHNCGKNGQSCCPKTRVLATLSSASIANGLTLQLNLLQNVIPQTLVALDWPEYTHNSWDGQYRGKNGNLAPKDTFSPDRLVQVSKMG